MTSTPTKTLVAGWFSFEHGHATAGDLLTRDLACEWLERAGYSYDIAVVRPFGEGVDLRTIDPGDYSHVVFVCGPFEQGALESALLQRFGRSRLIGLNLSMQVPIDVWNPFDLLLERDSTACVRADIAFLSQRPPVPVVGVCLVEAYPGAIDHVANAAIERLTASREMSIVSIDTRLDTNSVGLRTPAEVESLIARMDVLVTTRLHGMVLALKNGVPAIAIDPVAGGAKIRRQAAAIGWPLAFNADELTDASLRRALDFCLSEPAREEARRCAERATKMAEEVRDRFLATLASPGELEHRHRARLASPPDDEWMAAFSPAPDQAPDRNREESRRPTLREWLKAYLRGWTGGPRAS